MAQFITPAADNRPTAARAAPSRATILTARSLNGFYRLDRLFNLAEWGEPTPKLEKRVVDFATKFLTNCGVTVPEATALGFRVRASGPVSDLGSSA